MRQVKLKLVSLLQQADLTADREDMLECRMCKKKFQSQGSFKKHMSLLHQSKVRGVCVCVRWVGLMGVWGVMRGWVGVYQKSKA